jgi:hypothetical protein
MADSSETAYQLPLSEREFDIIFRCLNEMCNGVRMKDSEFETRVGVSKKRVSELIDKIVKQKKNDHS